jgi:predicted ATPase
LENFVTISGCPGGGKSTLLAELRQRGFPTIDEPGQRIAPEEWSAALGHLAWLYAVAFVAG